jgi:predicted secreted acid phosphatase
MTKIPTAVLEAASKIKLVILDVDGVMTDGTLYYGNNGEELKGFQHSRWTWYKTTAKSWNSSWDNSLVECLNYCKEGLMSCQ